MAELLNESDIQAGLAALSSDWSLEGDAIKRSIEADSFAAGIRLVDAVAAIADERDHHPDIDIRWTTITFALSTHSAGGLTQNDFDLAAEIDRLAG